jgi:hypothetical protein
MQNTIYPRSNLSTFHHYDCNSRMSEDTVGQSHCDGCICACSVGIWQSLLGDNVLKQTLSIIVQIIAYNFYRPWCE